jgi:hypothetical protein
VKTRSPSRPGRTVLPNRLTCDGAKNSIAVCPAIWSASSAPGVMNVRPNAKRVMVDCLFVVWFGCIDFFSLTVERLVLGLGERDSAFLARFAFSVLFRFRLLVVCRLGGFDRRRERSFVRSFRELHLRCQSRGRANFGYSLGNSWRLLG